MLRGELAGPVERVSPGPAHRLVVQLQDAPAPPLQTLAHELQVVEPDQGGAAGPVLRAEPEVVVSEQVDPWPDPASGRREVILWRSVVRRES